MVINRGNINESNRRFLHGVYWPPDVEDANMAIIHKPLCCSLASQKRLDPGDSGILGKVSMDVVSRRIPTELRPLRSGRKPIFWTVLFEWLWYYLML